MQRNTMWKFMATIAFALVMAAMGVWMVSIGTQVLAGEGSHKDQIESYLGTEQVEEK